MRTNQFPSPEEASATQVTWIAAFVGVALVCSIIVVFLWNPSNGLHDAAYKEAQTAITKQLKEPAKAKFPPFNAPGVSIEPGLDP